MVICAVNGCGNHSRHIKSKGFSLHTFPRDSKLREKWVKACKRSNRFSPNKARVCSDHFDEQDYERDLMSELLNLVPKKRLKPNVIPHINLPSKISDGSNIRIINILQLPKKRFDQQNL